MVWIAHGKTMVYYDSIVKARATAVKMIENREVRDNVMIFDTKEGKPRGIVSDYGENHYKYSEYSKKYGKVTYSIYKNGKIIR